MRAPDFWSQPPGLAARLLAPLGGAWQAAATLRRAATQPQRSPVPVVCVGNVVAGGSGKTPIVLSLAEIAAGFGVAAHIVTRGHGGRLTGPVQADRTRHDAAAVGDEALLLAASAPCWVARDRVAGVRSAAAAGAEAVLLDDGFQNPSIAKNLSLLVVDVEYGFGNGRVMPAGPLRETPAMGIARADAVVLLGDGDMPEVVRQSRRPILRAALVPVRAGWVAGSRVVAFAGIGRPAKFFATVRNAGGDIVAAHPFPDHHRFTALEIDRLRHEAMRADATLVTTAKDWVRLPADMRDGVAVLEIEVRWDDPAGIAGLLAGNLRVAPDVRRHEYDGSRAIG